MGEDIYLIIICIFVFLIVLIFLLKLRLFENKESFLWQMPYNALLAVALFSVYSFISLIYYASYDIDALGRTEHFVLLGLFSIISTVAVNYAARKIHYSKLLGEDRGPKLTLPSKLEKGNTYLVKDMERKRAFRLFNDALGLGLEGLTITRQNPKDVVNAFNLKSAKIIWLTEIENGKNLSPTNLEELSYVINNFIGASKSAIILFDGFEYLSDYNSFSKVLHLFQVLKDNVSLKGAIMMIYINPATIDAQNLKQMENEFKVI
jgi:hypothetical protein